MLEAEMNWNYQLILIQLSIKKNEKLRNKPITNTTKFNLKFNLMLDKLNGCITKLQNCRFNNSTNYPSTDSTSNLSLNINLETDDVDNEMKLKQVQLKGCDDEFNQDYNTANSFKFRRPSFSLNSLYKAKGTTNSRRDSFLSNTTYTPSIASSFLTLINTTTEQTTTPNLNYEGYLYKLYTVGPAFLQRKVWKRRYFVLSNTALIKFKSDREGIKNTDSFPITKQTKVYVTDRFEGEKFVFKVINANPNTKSNLEEVQYFKCEDSEDLKFWLNKIKSVITNIATTNDIEPNCSTLDLQFNYNSLARDKCLKSRPSQSKFNSYDTSRSYFESITDL